MSHEPPKAFDLTQEAADLRAELDRAREALGRNMAELAAARAELTAHREASRVDCDIHFGARRACGQCHDSLAQHLANARAELATEANPDQVVILREDYERLIASLPAGPRLVR